MPSNYTNELAVALEAVQVAARISRNVQSKITLDVMEKDNRSPVTVADFASQAVICRAIGRAFPKDPIMGEEESGTLRREENAPFLGGVLAELAAAGIRAEATEACDWIDRGCEKKYAPRFWTLDPIDGTKGFLRKEQYAVSLALIVDGQIQVAILGCPNLPSADGLHTGMIFHAVRGQGSWARTLDGQSPAAAIHASPVSDAAQARFCESVESGHTAHNLAAKVAEALGITRSALRIDSQVKYAAIARGDAEIYLRLPAKFGYKEMIWDHAGGVLIVEEAGGLVADVMGRPLEFDHGHELLANRGIVAANRALHGRVLAALAEIYARLPAPGSAPS